MGIATEFRVGIKKFLEEQKKTHKEAIKSLVVGIHRDLIQATPKDTVTLAYNYNTSLNAPDLAFNSQWVGKHAKGNAVEQRARISATYATKLKESVAVLQGIDSNTDFIFITNPTPYGPEVERTHPSARGFFQLTIRTALLRFGSLEKTPLLPL